MSSKETIKNFFNNIANHRLKWKKRNRFYYRSLEKYYSFIIPEGSRVLEIGCGTAELLNAVKPAYGVGVDFSENMIDIARKRFPSLKFYVQDAEDLQLEEKFDYIIMSDLVSALWDVRKAFKDLWKVSHRRTKVIISYHNYLWEPILKLGEKLRLKMKQPIQNWLHNRDIENLLDLVGFENIKIYRKLLFPKKIPVINFIFNTIAANLPIVNRLCLANLIVARPRVETNQDYSVSIIVPARNEKGNIENAILRTPKFGKSQEFIFIEGHSSDGTYEEILRVKEKYCDHNIVVMKQSGKGKGNAVREAFDRASGEILMILDADLSMPPEDLPQFYEVLRLNRGEFINGSRLVYEMDKQAMRFLNLMGNKFFAMLFTYLLGQRIKDTLCGTKVLFKSDYEKIKMNRKYFGDFDPFGDFDLIFGSAKLNLKIVEVPIRYRERAYGTTQISRFTHGWLLIKMSVIAAKKLKFL
jgi:ubiquinone/menaquinone biosynthesis C-methylase UbiE